MSVNDYDEGLFELIKELVERGDIEKGSDAYGVSQQVIHTGYASLSLKQRTLYDTVVISALKTLGEERRIDYIVNRAEP